MKLKDLHVGDLVKIKKDSFAHRERTNLGYTDLDKTVEVKGIYPEYDHPIYLSNYWWARPEDLEKSIENHLMDTMFKLKQKHIKLNFKL